MKKPVKEKDKVKMQKYVVALRQKLQERVEQLESKCLDTKKCESSRLQDEVTALIQMYRYYFEEIDKDPVKTQLNIIDQIDKIERSLATTKARVDSGEMSKEHFMEVVEMAKKNLLSIYKLGNIEQYADLLLAEPELLKSNKSLSTSHKIGIDQSEGEER